MATIWTPPGGCAGYDAQLIAEMENDASFCVALRILKLYKKSSSDVFRDQCATCIDTALLLAEKARRDFYDTIQRDFVGNLHELNPNSDRANALPCARELQLTEDFAWVPRRDPRTMRLPPPISMLMMHPPCYQLASHILDLAATMRNQETGPVYLDAALAVCIAADRDRKIASQAALQWQKK